MSGAFKVSRVYFNTSFGSAPFVSLVLIFGFDHHQEVKERSRRKSLFIRPKSGVWAALPHQWALVEEANRRLSKKSAKVDELHIVHSGTGSGCCGQGT
jgi:hypothetical protein